MRDLRGFREAVWVHRRAVGRTQQQLARSIGLHPDVLSHKLNGRDNAVLTTPEVIAIATTLAGWGALVTRADVLDLLELMGVPAHAVPAAAWAAPPLAALPADERTAGARRAANGNGRDPRSGPGPPEAAQQRPRLTPAPLPAPATPLIGRKRECADVAAALASSRLVTLTGVGGTGKTRLALQVARDCAAGFADGVAFIDLSPVGDPALMATAVARSLGLTPRSAEAAEDHLTEALGHRELLLVLDNLEQLLDEAQLLAKMLAAAPGLRLLATSRIPLRLYGEHTVRVPPLHLPEDDSAAAARDSEAVRLFVARARAARPDFDPDDGELAAIGAICTALDGLPLAIELAAARIRLYSPHALLPLLRSRLVLLTGGPRDLPDRQQTLRATLDWSYALLPDSLRHLFARAGVFAGPFDAAAAAAVSGDQDPDQTLERLAALADQSLLEVAAGVTPCFRMLQTVREFSLARLAQTGEQDDAQRRNLAHFLTRVVTARAGLDGPGQAPLLDLIEKAYPNLRAALDYAAQRAEQDGTCLDQGLRLATAIGPMWQRRGSVAEGVLQLEKLLALDAVQGYTSAPEIRARALLEACALACFAGDYARGAELARQGLTMCLPLGDHQGLARAHRFLGEASLAVGDTDAAEPHFLQELAEASLVGDLGAQAAAYNMLGQTARLRGDYRRANAVLWRARKCFRAASDPDGTCSVLNSLGEVSRDTGRTRRARRLFGAALRGHHELGNRRAMAYDLEGLAAAAALDGAGRRAMTYLGAARSLREQSGGPLPPVEQAILDRIFAPVFAALSARGREEAYSEGRNEPLQATIARALDELSSLHLEPAGRDIRWGDAGRLRADPRAEHPTLRLGHGRSRSARAAVQRPHALHLRADPERRGRRRDRADLRAVSGPAGGAARRPSVHRGRRPRRLRGGREREGR
jgi:predicted ATPase